MFLPIFSRWAFIYYFWRQWISVVFYAPILWKKKSPFFFVLGIWRLILRIFCSIYRAFLRRILIGLVILVTCSISQATLIYKWCLKSLRVLLKTRWITWHIHGNSTMLMKVSFASLLVWGVGTLMRAKFSISDSHLWVWEASFLTASSIVQAWLT